MQMQNPGSDLERTVTVRYGEKSWVIPAHKIVSNSSALGASIRHGGFKESQNNEIVLWEDSYFADAVACMCTYFLEGTYHAEHYATPMEVTHIKVYILADKYLCQKLIAKALGGLEKIVFGTAMNTSITDGVFYAMVAELIRIAYTYMPLDAQNHRWIRHVAKWGVWMGPFCRPLYVGQDIRFPVVRDVLLEFPEVEEEIRREWLHFYIWNPTFVWYG